MLLELLVLMECLIKAACHHFSCCIHCAHQGYDWPGVYNARGSVIHLLALRLLELIVASWRRCHFWVLPSIDVMLVFEIACIAIKTDFSEGENY